MPLFPFLRSLRAAREPDRDSSPVIPLHAAGQRDYKTAITTLLTSPPPALFMATTTIQLFAPFLSRQHDLRSHGSG